jgi:anti-anti-sigma factor
MDTAIHNNSEQITVVAPARIDATNVADFEKELAPLMGILAPDIALDCSELTYISSSGLRVFLSLQKNVSGSKGKLTLKNLRADIVEIFEMTGFSNIFTIE